METIFTVCAVVGGTLLACQFVLSLLGFGDHHDVGGHDFHVGDHAVGGHDGHDGHTGGHDHDESSWFAGVLTFRTITAALTVFGLAGLAGHHEGLAPAQCLALAVGAGAAAMLLVVTLMRTLYKLRADGTVRIDRAVGKTGTVYLPVPALRAGAGKVLLNLQNRTVEYQAVTSQDTLPAGAKIRVVAVVSSDTVEVVLVTAPERSTHV